MTHFSENNSGDFQTEFFKRYRQVKKHKKLLLRFLIAFFVLVTLYNIFCTRIYKSTATIIPIDSPRGDMFSALTGQGVLGALSGLVGGFNTSADKLINVLTSRSVTEAVINNLNLLPLLFPGEWDAKKNRWKDPEEVPLMEDAVKIMQKEIVKIEDTKEGLISVTVLWKDPELAAKIAGQYLDELQVFLNLNSFSMGKKNRVFLEERLEKTKDELAKAENTLKAFQEKNKIISIDAQAEMLVKTIANIKSELITRDYQLGFLRDTTGLHTAEAKKIIAEQKELERQLAKRESGDSGSQKKNSNDSTVSVKDFPTLEVEYLRLKRDFLILEQVFELLTTQYELAKIEEVRDQIAYQVIDQPSVLIKRFKPKIKLNTAIALFAAFIFALLTIVIIESVDWRQFKE